MILEILPMLVMSDKGNSWLGKRHDLRIAHEGKWILTGKGTLDWTKYVNTLRWISWQWLDAN